MCLFFFLDFRAVNSRGNNTRNNNNIWGVSFITHTRTMYARRFRAVISRFPSYQSNDKTGEDDILCSLCTRNTCKRRCEGHRDGTRGEGRKYKTNFCDGSCYSAYCAPPRLGCQIKRFRIFVVIVAPRANLQWFSKCQWVFFPTIISEFRANRVQSTAPLKGEHRPRD